MSFSEQLKAERKRLNLSQVKFGEVFEIPRRTVENWETGKIEPPTYVQKLIIEKLQSIKPE